MIYNGSYGFGDLEQVVQRTVTELMDRADRFDVIATRGMSGVTVASPVALKLGKELVVVRKPEDAEHAHSNRKLIGSRDLKGKRWIFLDDFVSSGSTFRAVHLEMLEQGALLVGQYEYEDHRWRQGDQMARLPEAPLPGPVKEQVGEFVYGVAPF